MSGDKSEPAVKSGASDASDPFRRELQESRTTKPEQESFDSKLLAFAEMDKKSEIKLTGQELEKLLPDFAHLIKDANLKDVTITKEGDSHYRFKLSMPGPDEKKVPQELEKHGCNSIHIKPDFAFDIKKTKDGNILVDNINGVRAAKRLKYDLTKVEIAKELKEENSDPTKPEYETKITSTVKAFGSEIQHDYRDPMKVLNDFQKAFEQLNERFKEKKTSALELPSPYRSVLRRTS